MTIQQVAEKMDIDGGLTNAELLVMFYTCYNREPTKQEWRDDRVWHLIDLFLTGKGL